MGAYKYALIGNTAEGVEIYAKLHIENQLKKRYIVITKESMLPIGMTCIPGGELKKIFRFQQKTKKIF